MKRKYERLIIEIRLMNRIDCLLDSNNDNWEPDPKTDGWDDWD